MADEASPAATEIGAANTLSFGEGEIRAENTDAPGLLAALPERAAGKRALVLGAGGSARAAAWALARERASVEIWNRTGERSAELAGALSATSAGEAGHLAAVSAEQVRDTGYQLIVNCTAVGMDAEGDPFDELPLDPERLGEGTVLVDLVYGGEETALVAEARGRGARVVEGVEVLVSQGGESLRIWTGLEPPLAVMREAARSDREPDEDEGSEIEPGEGEIEAEELQITPTESVQVIRSEPDVLEVEATYAAEGKPPPKHLHPGQDEHFEVLEGSLRVRVSGEEKDLGAGETLDVPRGTVHQMWNPGNREAVVSWETRPAGRTREWFGAIDRLYRDGRVGKNGEPGPLAFAALLTEYKDVFRLAVGPPFLVQGALGLLAPFGRARGYLPE